MVSGAEIRANAATATVDAPATDTDLDAPPKPRRTRGKGKRAWLQWAAGFLVIVLGAELAVRATASKLPEPLDYFSADSQTVVDDMNVLQAHHVQSDLTFVGTSMVRRDIDANQVEKLIPGVKWAHNVALPGAQAPVVDRWLLQEVIPRIHPKRVVWGMSSLDFNSGRDNKTIDIYNIARATQNGFYGAADRVMENSAISEHRDTLRDPLTLLHAAEGSATKYGKSKPLGDRAVWKLGYKKTTPAQLKKLRAAHLITVRDHQLRHYHTGSVELAAYEHTLRELKAQGIDVVIVFMPVTTGYIGAHPNGAADFDSWKRDAAAVAAALHVPVIDESRAMPDSSFRDYEHLYAAPAHQFTAQLSAKLKAMGW